MKYATPREYKRLAPDYAELMTVDEWLACKNVIYGNYDGNGYWVRNGKQSNDEVFSTEKEDATHVAWYPK